MRMHHRTDVFLGRPDGLAPGSSERGLVAVGSSRATENIFSRRVAKNLSKRHYIYEQVLSASVARPVMFAPHAGMPRINRGMVYLGGGERDGSIESTPRPETNPPSV